SEVPLGTLLSGGIDSTVVTAIMCELAGSRVKTFSVGFSDQIHTKYDERPFARLVADYYGTDHHEVAISNKDFASALPSCVWHLEEPVADPASVPLYYVAKLAKDHVTVVLSGEGADELLGGYTYASAFRGFARAGWFRSIPRFIRHGVIGPFNDTL